MDKYKYRWKYEDHERPQTQCYDCGIEYNEFEDMVIPDKYWEQINPTYHKGAGLLCPTCIANRLNYLGVWYNSGFFNFKLFLY